MRVDVKTLERLDISGEIILSDEEHRRLMDEPEQGLVFTLGNMLMHAKAQSGQVSGDGRVLVAFEVVGMDAEPERSNAKIGGD